MGGARFSGCCPLQYSFLDNPHGERSPAGCSPWGCKESERSPAGCSPWAAKSQTRLSNKHATFTFGKSCPSLDCTCLIYKIKVLHRLRQTAQKRAPSPKVRGSGRECQAATAQERLRGATPCPRLGRQPRAVSPHQRSGQRLTGATPRPRSRGCAGLRRAERSYSTFKVRRGGQ